MADGNHKYPASRRMFSRPYLHHNHLYNDETDIQICKFRDALHSIGEDLIGEPFDFCCDLDKYVSHFSPAFWDEETVATLSIAKSRMKESLPFDAQRALDRIVDHISRSAVMIPGDRPHSLQRQEPYDIQALTENFKTLWHHDIMLDTRITHAEELFFCGLKYHTGDYRDKPGRLLATLDWMAKPDNAERISLMFLYSRLAQHYGEINPRSFELTRKIAHDIERGKADDVIEKLGNRPDAFYLANVALTPKETVEFIESCAGIKDRDRNKAGLVNPEALSASAQTIIRDYQTLRDGSWAREQRGPVRELWEETRVDFNEPEPC